MKKIQFVIPSVLAFGLLTTLSNAATVVAVADIGVTEQSPNADGSAAPSGGNGAGASMNFRWAGASSNRNDIIAIRFDLAGYNLADLSEVTLSLTSDRAGTMNAGIVYGVAPNGTAVDATTSTIVTGTAGTWLDTGGTTFKNVPGLTFDGLSTTQGLNTSELTNLLSTTTGALTQGQIVTFTSAAMTSFVNSYVGTSITFLISATTAGSNQTRFATRDATGLNGATNAVAPGTYAPTLTFNVIPEPSSLLLTALGGIALASRRRRI